MPAPAKSPASLVAALIARFDAPTQRVIKGARTRLRKRLPTANELVYDYSRNFVLSYGATEAGGQAIVALSADAKGVRIAFTGGKDLSDPTKLLKATGKVIREMPLTAAADLDTPAVVALLRAAERLADPRLPKTGRGQTVIKPNSAKR